MYLYAEPTVLQDTTWAAAPDVTLGFDPQEWYIYNTDVAGVIEFSFDGVNIAGKLAPSPGVTSVRSFRSSSRRLFLRRAVAGAGIVVQVSASSYP
jgi:hypothetical protein